MAFSPLSVHLQNAALDFEIRHETELVLRSLVEDVDAFDREITLYDKTEELKEEKNKVKDLSLKVTNLSNEKEKLINELQSLRFKASEVRTIFLSYLSSHLVSSHDVMISQKETRELRINCKTRERENEHLLSFQSELTDQIDKLKNEKDQVEQKLDETIKAVEDAKSKKSEINTNDNNNSNDMTSSSSSSTYKQDNNINNINNINNHNDNEKIKNVISILSIEDASVLEVFGFLEANEILAFSQTCRATFYRVDKLFGIGSSLIQEDWPKGDVIPTEPRIFINIDSNTNNNGPNTSTSNTNSGVGSIFGSPIASLSSSSSTTLGGDSSTTSPGPTTTGHRLSYNKGLTKEMAEELTGKLTSKEMNVIISMAEQIRKQTNELTTMQSTIDDLEISNKDAESVKDFLVDKLRSAEEALKSSLQTQTALRKQATSDREVMAYMDGRGLSLEEENKELRQRCERLEASLDLQRESHSHVERHLKADISECRERLDHAESTFKAQKKLLVREVKSLRGSLSSTSAELLKYRSQMEAMRDAVQGKFL